MLKTLSSIKNILPNLLRQCREEICHGAARYTVDDDERGNGDCGCEGYLLCLLTTMSSEGRYRLKEVVCNNSAEMYYEFGFTGKRI